MRWSGDVMVLGKFPVPGRSTNLDNSSASLHTERNNKSN